MDVFGWGGWCGGVYGVGFEGLSYAALFEVGLSACNNFGFALAVGIFGFFEDVY